MRYSTSAWLACIFTALMVVQPADADVVDLDPPNTYFEKDLMVSTGHEHLIGRPNFPFHGQTLNLQIRIDAGDEVSWRFNGEDIPNATGSLLSIPNLDTSHSGNYQCVVTRNDTSVASQLVTINVVSRPQASLIDETFQAAPISGLEAFPLAIRDDGWIAVRHLNSTLYQRIWRWVSPDGTKTEHIYTATGPLNPEGVVKFFADGSYLFREQGVFTYTQSDGESSTVNTADGMLDNASSILRTPNQGWILGDSIDVTGINSAGEILFQKNVNDYGVVTIFELVEVPNSGGRFFLIGSVGDTPETYGQVAVLIEPTGEIVAGFKQISIDRIAPTLLPNQTLAHCEDAVLRLFDMQGNQTHRVEIPELDMSDAVAFSPDGWLYASIRVAGLMRFDLQGNRDHDYVAYFPAESSSFTPSIIFDHLNRPLLGIMPANHASLDDASRVVRLKNSATPLAAPPVIVAEAEGLAATNVSWSARGSAVGSGPLTYQWQRVDKTGTTALPPGPRLHFPSIQVGDLGLYQLSVTSPHGSTLGPLIDLRPKLRPRLFNLSGRGAIGNQSELIAGFVIETWRQPESQPENSVEKVLLRAVGPTLTDFDVETPATDPRLVLERKENGSIIENDDWLPWGALDNLILRAQGVFPLRANSADAQIMPTLDPGIYLSTVQAKDDASGVALAEVYIMGRWGEAELSNLSLRGKVGVGENVLIGGFIVSDPEGFDRPLRLLIRAVGPTLQDYGVSGTCADPELTLFDSENNVVATNNDWGDSDAAELAALASTLGAFALPADSKDAAMIVELPPGAYTSHVGCGDGAGGEALFEIYRIAPE